MLKKHSSKIYEWNCVFTDRWERINMVIIKERTSGKNQWWKASDPVWRVYEKFLWQQLEMDEFSPSIPAENEMRRVL